MAREPSCTTLRTGVRQKNSLLWSQPIDFTDTDLDFSVKG
jgi:hypothetical protein